MFCPQIYTYTKDNHSISFTWTRLFAHLHSSGLSESRRRNLSWGRMRAKQLSLRPPGGKRGKSKISLPSTMDSQLLWSATTWSGGESASRHTIRFPSTVNTRYFSFHCLNMKPPWRKTGGKTWIRESAQFLPHSQKTVNMWGRKFQENYIHCYFLKRSLIEIVRSINHHTKLYCLGWE